MKLVPPIRNCLIALLALFSISPAVASQNSDDPLFFRQWQFKGNTTPSVPGNYRLGVIDIENERGKGVENVIMLIASGMKADHEDLVGSFWVNPDEIPNDGIDNDNNGYIDDIHGINLQDKNGDLTDYNGWGTNVAGIISAQSNNGLGIRGISTNTKIVGCKTPSNFNSLSSELMLEMVHECIDYAVDLKNNAVNVFAISFAFIQELSVARHKFDENTEKAVLNFRNIVDKIEKNDLLWIGTVTDEPGNPPFGSFELLDYSQELPLSLYSPNFIAASRLDKRMLIKSNYGRGLTSSVFTEDILTTTPFQKVSPNGKYILDVTPDNAGVESSDTVEVVTNPDNTSKKVWHIEALANNGGFSEIILPPVDLSKIDTSALIIDVNLKRLKKNTGFYNKHSKPHPPSSRGGVDIKFKVEGSDKWQHFVGRFLKSREIWDLYSGELNLSRNFNPAIQADSSIQFKIIFQGDETFVESVQVWAAENGVSVAGYDYSFPENVGVATLSAAAGVIKAYNDDWPAWKVANAITASSTLSEFFLEYNYPINITGKSVFSLLGSESEPLNCNNRIIQRRLVPSNSIGRYAIAGQPFYVKTKSINCELPGPPYTYTNSITGEKYLAKDDGEGFDRFANDGLGIVTINSDITGLQTLSNDHDYDLNLTVLNSYQDITETPFEWLNFNKNNHSRYAIWRDIPVETRIGGSLANISKQFSDNVSHLGVTTSGSINPYIGITSNNEVQTEQAVQADKLTVKPKLKDNAPQGTDLEYDISNIKYAKAVSLSEPLQVKSTNEFYKETTNSSLDHSYLFDKGLSGVRIYAAPREQSAHAISKWVNNDSSIRKIVVNFGDYAQIVFYEKQSKIHFNYNKLPEFLEGLEYEIGIEVGQYYRNRKKITLTSNTSYMMDVDTDGDGVLDFTDEDNDNDGVNDGDDVFPYNAAENKDHDLDGLGDNADLDDDNDGIKDTEDKFPLDTDNDGVNNQFDDDDDGDGVKDEDDVFPLDSTESTDFDNDGLGNNADLDDDNDGVEDKNDAFPYDQSEHTDTDEDGLGNNSDFC